MTHQLFKKVNFFSFYKSDVLYAIECRKMVRNKRAKKETMCLLYCYTYYLHAWTGIHKIIRECNSGTTLKVCNVGYIYTYNMPIVCIIISYSFVSNYKKRKKKKQRKNEVISTQHLNIIQKYTKDEAESKKKRKILIILCIFVKCYSYCRIHAICTNDCRKTYSQLRMTAYQIQASLFKHTAQEIHIKKNFLCVFSTATHINIYYAHKMYILSYTYFI